MNQNSGFSSKTGFILAAVGSAIGLGNIWRFPAVAYQNGGGAFLIPYIVALLTTGLGVLILEFALGNKYRGSSPLTFVRINKKLETIGWFPAIITFVISTYYSIILAYSLRYLVSSFTTAWGNDTEGYFFHSILQVSESATDAGSVVPGILIPLLLIWAFVLVILFRGVKKGIESFNKFMVPLLVVLFSIIVIRALTLSGSTLGLNALFTPDWSAITDAKVWVAAYSQIFFSLSIAMGVMVTYSSYLPKKSELSNSALITGFANSSFEILAGIGVFSALGFMANNLQVPVGEVTSSGLGLAFVVFPAIINTMPASEIFGALFFGTLFISGLTSLISILEVSIAGITDKFKLTRSMAVSLVTVPAILISFIYTRQNGINVLDVVDYFINNIGVVLSALLLLIGTLYIAKQGKEIITYVNSYSHFKIGTLWIISLKYITPFLLSYMFINSLIQIITSGYGGFSNSFLLKYGWGVIGVIFVATFVLTKLKWHETVAIHHVEVEDISITKEAV